MTAQQARPALELVDVRKSFGPVEVLKGISAQVAPGETVCLVGPSGSGKSTLLRCVNLLEVPTSGTIRVEGEEITAPQVDLNALRARIGMVFQHFHLFPHLTVRRNITLALTRVRKLDKDQADEVAELQLSRVGLGQFADRRPAALSGGQQQRVAIARALAMEPTVMLFDEATSALDPELVKGVLAVMRDLAGTGMTMLVVTHEMGFAKEAADRVMFLESGQVVEEGNAHELLTDPRTDRLRRFLSQVL
ncbi:amino acid ABC transporter ATP-binding protein [Peterkaempfera sp. SMS 1(5)a]|uniref:amino acid ABC transporter ATP-binding protein n=1 Tax=Peterkaempfera podocarpi TaxID=3232308 RepID=UPI0036712C4A